MYTFSLHYLGTWAVGRGRTSAMMIGLAIAMACRHGGHCVHAVHEECGRTWVYAHARINCTCTALTAHQQGHANQCWFTMNSRKSQAFKYVEVTLLTAIIIVVWLLMSLPVVIYFVVSPNRLAIIRLMIILALLSFQLQPVGSNRHNLPDSGRNNSSSLSQVRVLNFACQLIQGSF